MELGTGPKTGVGQANISLPKPKLTDATEIKCEECEGILFEEQFLLRKFSKLLTGSEKDQMIPIPVIVCAACGTVYQDSIPAELKK